MRSSAQESAGRIDTGKITGRRTLRFESIDQVLFDAEGLVEAERAGRLKRLGNWTLGQTLGHLASWAEYSYTGSPLTPPWLIKLLLRTQKRKFLYGSMRAGVRIPGVEGGTVATEALPTDEGLARLRNAMQRLQAEAPTAPHKIFGPMTHEEWIGINLRHAELHLSFLLPE